jgi:hypothetical protein
VCPSRASVSAADTTEQTRHHARVTNQLPITDEGATEDAHTDNVERAAS